MVEAYKAELIKVLREIKELDSVSILTMNSIQDEFENLKIGKFGLTEFLTVFDRSIINFEQAIEEDYLIYLPAVFNVVSENYNGTYNILTEWATILSKLNENISVEIDVIVDRIVYYQIVFGFWDKSIRKFHYAKNEEIAHLKSDLKITKVQAAKEFTNYKNKKTEVEELQKTLNEFYLIKTKELQTISDSSSGALTALQNLNDTNAQAQTVSEKINSVLSLQETNLKVFNERKTEFETTFKNSLASYNNLTDKLTMGFAENKSQLEILINRGNETNLSLTNALSHIESQKTFIEDKKKEVTDLIGLAADGVLGHTFLSRRDFLADSVQFWRNATAVVACLAIIWVVAVFRYFHSNVDIHSELLDAVLNILKTSPGFVLLGFCITQYNKERLLQEEYAFKAAVAMTITAYSDRIENADKKEGMLITATEKVYRSPLAFNKKETPLISFGSKSLTETLKDISESIKNIKT